MNLDNELLANIDKIHTTELGIGRISKNLGLENINVVEWCKIAILKPETKIYRQGKNWYADVSLLERYNLISENQCNSSLTAIITVNAYNYCIITAHKKKIKNCN